MTTKWYQKAMFVAILALMAGIACNCSSDDDDDVTCENTTYEYGSVLAELCFMPNTGTHKVQVAEDSNPNHLIPPDHPLMGASETINSSCISECGIATIYRPNFPSDATVVIDGVTYDAENQTDINVSGGGVGFEIVSCADPSRILTMSCESERWFPNWLSTLKKWESEGEGAGGHFVVDTAATQTIKYDEALGVYGIIYSSANHSDYAPMNQPFDPDTFEVKSVLNSDSTPDCNDNGCLVEYNVEDLELPGQIPPWITMAVTNGTDVFGITVVDENHFRVNVPANELTELTIQFTDEHLNAVDRQTIEGTVEFNLSNPCDGVDCNDHGECVEAEGEGICDCDTGWNNETDCADCATGYHFNDDETECLLDEECLPGNASCNDNGTCTDDTGVIECACFDGYDGDTCDVCDTPTYTEWPLGSGTCILDFCLGETCNGNGTCDDPSTGVCTCNNDWLDVTDDCGSCEPLYDDISYPACDECTLGYTNHPLCDQCDYPTYSEWPASSGICVLNPCDGVTCNSNGTCSQNGETTYECNCSNIYLDPADDCGSCLGNYQNYPACDQCATGYTNHPTCDECALGYVDNPLSPGECILDPCDGVSCSGNGTCNVTGPGTYECACDNIWLDPSTDCASCIEGAVNYPACDECPTGYTNHPTCDTCDTGYTEWPTDSGICIVDQCDGQTCSGNGSCDDPSTGDCTCDNAYFDVSDDCGSCINSNMDYADDCNSCMTGYSNFPSCDVCDTGYTEWPLSSGICIVDLCDGQTCNGNGSCNDPSTGVCTCDNAYLDSSDDCGSCTGNQDYADDCNSCLLGYENYPSCTPDVTAPADPVITTNGGLNMGTQSDDFTLEGTCDSDTYTFWVSIDGGAATQVSGYVPFSTSWSYEGNISVLWESHDYCFHSEDDAGNPSGEDCINVNRVP